MRAFILILVLSSCSTVKIAFHEPLVIPEQCVFEKFTETEKGSMIESVGRKIHRNQEKCRIRQVRIDSLINKHNLEHSI